MEWLDWIKEHQTESWVALALALGVAELVSLDLILAMLAAGAAVGAVSALLGAPGVAQVLIAVVTSVLMLAVVRPVAKRRLDSAPELKLGHTKHVGQTALVLEPITDLQPGRVRLAGQEWSAKPYDPHLSIAAGESVEVLEIRGAFAIVHPIATLEP